MHFIVYVAVIAGAIYLFNRYEHLAEKQAALESRLRWAEAREELLTQFICESLALRDDAKKFSERGFHCGHDLISEDHKKCICTEFKGRANSILDRNEFYDFKNEVSPVDLEDGLYLYQEAEDKKHTKENQQIFLPYLKRLNQIDPKTVTAEHIKWLMRDGLYDSHIARYLGWLLPSLNRGLFAIKDPEGTKILNELSERLGGKGGELCHAVTLMPRPVKQL